MIRLHVRTLSRDSSWFRTLSPDHADDIVCPTIWATVRRNHIVVLLTRMIAKGDAHIPI